MWASPSSAGGVFLGIHFIGGLGNLHQVEGKYPALIFKQQRYPQRIEGAVVNLYIKPSHVLAPEGYPEKSIEPILYYKNQSTKMNFITSKYLTLMVAFQATKISQYSDIQRFKPDKKRLIISPGLITFQASMVTERGENVQTQERW